MNSMEAGGRPDPHRIRPTWNIENVKTSLTILELNKFKSLSAYFEVGK